MTARRVRVLAPFLASLASVVAILVLEAVYPVREPGTTFAPDSGIWTVVQGVTLTGAAAVILWRRAHPLGWTMAGFGLFWTVDGVVEAYIRIGLGPDDAWPGMTWAIWFVARPTSLLLPTLMLLVLLFPTGRFAPGRWGLVGKVVMLLELVICVLWVVVPWASFGRGLNVPPDVDLDPTTLTFLAGVGPEAIGVARAVAVLGFLVPVATVAVRHHRARGVERDQMRWLLWGVLMIVVGVGSFLVAGQPQGADLVLLATFNVPFVAMAIAVVNPTLVRVDELLSRTLVFLLLSASVVAVDLAALAALTRALDERLEDRQVLVVVLLLSVLVYNPVRAVLLGRVRRLVLGDRDHPYDVVAGLAETLESTDDTERQLGAVADAVARAFGVGFVSVEVDRVTGERVTATVGERPERVRTLPIAFQGEEVGRLVLPARGVRAPLGRTDERLLGDLVRQAASAARTTQLAEELQDNRERLVIAREEELRRIRRDLHDGLGPALGGVVFQLESARLLVGSDPARARAQLTATKAHLQDVVVDVRRLVHDLRPPALDDLGLVGALRQQARQHDGVDVDVTADDLPTLPAAVEVAAYRIVGEALTNVRRHAHATTCRVQLVVDAGDLLVEVADDGVGIDPTRQAGIGLLSLRERADELGGRSEVVCPDGGGTIVRARLPLHPVSEPLRLEGVPA